MAVAGFSHCHFASCDASGKTLLHAVAELNERAKKPCLTVSGTVENKLILRAAGNTATAAFLEFNAKDATLRCSFHGAYLKLTVDRNDELMWQSTASPSNVWTCEQVAQQTVKAAYSNYKG
jgi:hypothetical protein